MSQRAYILPFSTVLAGVLCSYIRENDIGLLQERTRGDRLRFALIASYSKQAESVLSKLWNRKRLPDELYYFVTAQRPFCIASDNPVETVRSLFESPSSSGRIFRKELRALGGTKLIWRSPEGVKDPGLAGIDSLAHLPEMYESIRSSRPFSMEAPKLIEDSNGISFYSQTETETKELSGVSLVQAFGEALGTSYGRLLGLISPSWWLGNNFWLGKITSSTPQSDSVAEIKDYLVRNSTSSASLFSSLEIPGLLGTLPITLEPYTTGLVLAHQFIEGLSLLLTNAKADILYFFGEANGVEPQDYENSLTALLESLDYCKSTGMGLIEGDEIVGQFGIR